MGIQKTSYQKTYKLQVGSQEFTVDFKGCKKQFYWLKISLVYDKRDKHLTIYDSYKAECAVKMIKSIELANISDTYNATNTMKFVTSNDKQKHMLWKQYVAWHCNGYSAAPIFDYISNTVFQELLLKSDYFGTKSDEKVFIKLWDSLRYTNKIEKLSRNDSKLIVTIELKIALAHNIKHKTYTIKSQDDVLEA